VLDLTGDPDVANAGAERLPVRNLPRHPKAQELKGRGNKAGETGMGTLHGNGNVYANSSGTG
jgi:hypothetical protein